MLSCIFMWRSLSLLLSLVLSFLLLTPLAHAQVVSLSATASRVDLGGKMAWLKDEGGQLGIHEVEASRGFQPLVGELNLGFTPATIWLRVEVARTQSAPRQWLLEVTNPVLDDLRLYNQARDGGFAERRAGDHLEHALREMDYRQAVFKLDFDADVPQTLWLRLQSRNSLSARLLLWQPEAFHQAVTTETLLYGLYFGCFITILIFHLFFWRWTREPVGGWYALYVASNAMIGLLSAGYFQQYSHWSGTVTDAILGVLICNALWITTMFAVVQIDLNSVMPRVRRAMVNSSALLSALFIALTLAVGYPVGVIPAQLVSMVWGVLLLALPLWLWWCGHMPARFFSLAFSVFIAGSVLRYVSTLGLVEPNLLTDYGYQIGSLIHMLMMSVAITGRYNAMKRDNLAAQILVNSSLEEQVAVRTHSLKQEISWRETLEIDLRKALEVEQRARQEQRDFVAMVSHEFRTPLAIINTSVHHVARDLEVSQGKSLQRCGNIKDSVARMSELMDEYLSLDRIEGDKQALQLTQCDVGEVVAGVVAEWPSNLVDLVRTSVPPSMLADWKLLQVAVRNLITNGLRHSQPGEPLRLWVRGQPEGGVCIEINDTGSGIPSDEIDRVFQKYFRGRGSKDKPGAGLGLYLVERIAQMHGGSVAVESTLDHGSRFSLKLPGSQALAGPISERLC